MISFHSSEAPFGEHDSAQEISFRSNSIPLGDSATATGGDAWMTARDPVQASGTGSVCPCAGLVAQLASPEWLCEFKQTILNKALTRVQAYTCHAHTTHT